MFRLKEFRKEKKISQQELADFLGVTQATLSGWENEKFEPDIHSIKKIANYFKVSVDELFGQTEMSSAPVNSIKIPVLGYVAAGIPIEAIEEILDYEELDPAEFDTNYQYFGLKIKGDSMSPRIQDGDVVIVRSQPQVENGEIAIVCLNGDNATCKQIKIHSDGISLISFNAAYDVKFYTKKEVIELPITILGKVIELRRKF